MRSHQYPVADLESAERVVPQVVEFRQLVGEVHLRQRERDTQRLGLIEARREGGAETVTQAGRLADTDGGEHVADAAEIGDTQIDRADDALGGEIEDNDVIITRTISNQGKSRITLGGLPSTANDVNNLCQELVEIHAQASTARLTKPNVARELLDRFGDLSNQIQTYREKFTDYRDLLNRISDLEKAISVRDEKLAELREFEQAVKQLKPKTGELSEIDGLISKLGSVEALGQSTSTALNLLSENDESITKDRKSTRLNSSHMSESRMPSSA